MVNLCSKALPSAYVLYSYINMYPIFEIKLVVTVGSLHNFTFVFISSRFTFDFLHLFKMHYANRAGGFIATYFDERVGRLLASLPFSSEEYLLLLSQRFIEAVRIEFDLNITDDAPLYGVLTILASENWRLKSLMIVVHVEK